MADLRAMVLPASGKAQRQKDADRVIAGLGVGTAAGNLEVFSAGGTVDCKDHLSLSAGKNFTGVAGAGAITLGSLTGVFQTPTGAHTLNGDVTLAANKNLLNAAGTGLVDFSLGTGLFKTTTGAVTIGPGAVTVSGAATFSAAGTGLTVSNNAAVTGDIIVTGEVSANGGVGRSIAGVLVVGADAGSTSVELGKAGANTAVKGSLIVDQNLTITGTSTHVGASSFDGNVTLGNAPVDTISVLGSITSASTSSIDFSGASGIFKTTTGTVTLAGSTELAAGKNFTGLTGAGFFDLSLMTGLFKTTVGAVTLAGDTTLAVGKNIAVAAGASAVDFSGGTGLFKTTTGAVTVGPGAVTIGGGSAAVTITAGAASTWSTTAGALTITSAAACTWSTSAGALTLNGFAGINLQNQGTTVLVIGSAVVTVQGGAVLGTTGTGNINLPNNASARFQIEGTAVGATVTSANLNTLTNASNADALHTHAVTTSGAIELTSKTSGEALATFDLVVFDDSGGSPRVFKADANGAGELVNAAGFNKTSVAGAGLTVTVVVNGEVSPATTQFDVAPGTADVGKPIFMSETPGKLTLTAPTATGSTVQKVGVLTDGSGSPKVLIQMGDAYVL